MNFMKMEPNLNEKAVAALYAPSACIVNPWDLAIAYAETAVKNGFEVNSGISYFRLLRTTERSHIFYIAEKI